MPLTIRGRRAYVGTLGRDLEPDRPTVTFVHGAGLDHTVWTPFARHFARHGCNTVAVDLPGHGRSEGPALDRIGDLAGWVDAVLDATGVREAVLIGHSLGSLIALELAARGTRAAGLALVGIGVPMPVSEALLDAARRDHHDALDMLNLWGHSPSAHLGGFSTPGVWMIGSQLRLLERTGPGVLFADLTACNQYAGALGQAAQVTCPTLLVLGDRDVMTPVRATRELQAALPNARTTVLAGCGHALMAERPNEVLDALIGLVGQATRPEEATHAL